MENKTMDEFHDLHRRLQAKTEITRGLDWREESLARLHDVIRSREDQIFQALREDLGKPEFEAYVTETSYVLEEITTAKRELRSWSRARRLPTPLKLQPARSEILTSPKGVVLILAPWNFPFQLALAPLVAAVAAGNACVLKPSELAPATAHEISEIVKLTWPLGEVVCVEGGADVATRLLERRWDHVFFTGGTEIGRKVMMSCAKYLTSVTLELGGKSPCVIDRDVDLEVASRRVVWGKTINSGQTCIAPDYLLVHDEIREPFVEELRKRALEFHGENPLASESYGRIISRGHFERLEKLLDGARVLFGGQRDADSRRFALTVVEAASGDGVMSEEIFGPILPVLSWRTEAELDSILDLHPRPLAFYVFSRSSRFSRRLLERRSFGGAAVNDVIVQFGHDELPFGGIGESGMGAYHGRFGFDAFSHQKAVVTRGFHFDVKLRYPPYGEAWKKLKRFL